MSAGTIKQVANTLKSVLETEVMKRTLDRSTDIEGDALDMLEQWGVDLFTRKPRPAVNANGEFQGTDLDLSTFLTALAGRKAVIEIPKYTGLRAATKTEGQRRVGERRFGNIISLYANKEVFTFGVKIKDMSVVETNAEGKETAGVPRNFALLDVEGKWHEGWAKIVFVPSAKENSFMEDKALWTDNTVYFNQFVHKNRWASMYGHPYFQTKALIDRITDQAAFLRTEIARLQAEGIKYPATGEGAKTEWPKSEKVGEEKAIKVKAMEVEIDLPEYTSQYPTLPSTQEALVEATKRRNYWIYNLCPMLTFAVRSVELAYFNFGFVEDGSQSSATSFYKEERMPGWIENAKWERDYQVPRGRTKWNRLVLFQPAVGERGVSIRYRVWDKTERISVKNEE